MVDSHEALTLPIPNANFIWYCSWASILSAIVAYSRPTTARLAIIPASVFTTSIFYWRNPIHNSWRRKLDVAVVLSGLSYQSYHVYTQYNTLVTRQSYAALIGMCGSCYLTSCYFMKRGQVWSATYAHASIHIIANIANIIVYKGEQKPQIK
jgi:membrane protease YdiL (CAAX protease family)